MLDQVLNTPPSNIRSHKRQLQTLQNKNIYFCFQLDDQFNICIEEFKNINCLLVSKMFKPSAFNRAGDTKGETIKGLSPRTKCYYFSHSRASRIQKFFLSARHRGRKYFAVFHGPSTLITISSTLFNYVYNIQGHIYNLVKHLKWNFMRKQLTIEIR